MTTLAQAAQDQLKPWLQRAEQIRSQRPQDKNKLYALHAPEVKCIDKGKARKPYEFGVKVSLAVAHNGCSPDNAACESFFGRLKTEMFFARNWLSTSIEEFIAALDAYIRWYNEVRIKSSLGCRSPAQHRRQVGIAA